MFEPLVGPAKYFVFLFTTQLGKAISSLTLIIVSFCLLVIKEHNARQLPQRNKRVLKYWCEMYLLRQQKKNSKNCLGKYLVFEASKHLPNGVSALDSRPVKRVTQLIKRVGLKGRSPI